MGYSLEKEPEIVSQQKKKLNRDLQICREVYNTLNSPGWKNTIGPILDTMIISILGGKVGDNWVSGKIDKARSDERREFHIGAKQALIELHQRINNHIRQIEIIEKQLKEIDANEKQGYRVPLAETRYNPEI